MRKATAGPSQPSTFSSYIKREVRIPPPAPTDVTVLRPCSGPFTPVSTLPSDFTQQQQISIRPLSSLIDPDEQPGSKQDDNRTEVLSLGDWRDSCKNIYDRLHYILENDEKFQDIVFEVDGNGSNGQFKAHKLILRIASPVFDSMFKKSDASLQGTNQYATVIPITDVDPPTFKLLLQYIYTDKIDKEFVSESEMVNLLQASLRYEVRQLYSLCLNHFARGISDKVVVRLMEIASAFNDNFLMELCLMNMARNVIGIFEQDEFLKLSGDNLLKLVERDDLNIDEVSLFEAIIKWGQCQCITDGLELTSSNLRSLLEDLILKIRFPLMKAEEITLTVAPSNILTPEEQIEIYRYVSLGSSKRTELPLPPTKFITTPRCPAKLLQRRESDTMSDFPESPERQGSLISTACADTTATEPESETASTVSSHQSDTLSKKPRKECFSKSSHKKRRHKDKNQPSSSKKFRVDMENLFEEPEKEFVLKNGAVCLKSIVSKLRSNSQIERIILDDVMVEDFKELQPHKIHLSKLRRFYLNLIIPVDDIKLGEFDRLLFFTTTGKEWKYEHLLKMNISVTIIINKIIWLKISPKDKHLTLSKYNGIQDILSSVKGGNIKSLAYSCGQTPLNFNDIPNTLRKLTITGISNSEYVRNFAKLPQEFPHLQEFVLFCPASVGGNADIDEIHWNDKVMFKDGLKKLSLAFTRLRLHETVRFVNVTKLCLHMTGLDESIEENFSKFFPRVEEVYFGGLKNSSTMLRSLLLMPTLSKITSYNCEWGLDDSNNNSRHLKQKMQLRKILGTEKNEKTFVLQKRNDNWKKEASAQKNYEFLQENLYHLFGFNNVYLDIGSYREKSHRSD